MELIFWKRIIFLERILYGMYWERGFNAFNSLFFLIVVTRINGLEQAGMFTLAYSTSCIIYVIGIYAGRIYQVTEADNTINDREFILNRLISTLLMIILILIFIILKKYDIFKAMVFFLLTLTKALEAFSDVIYGILQKKEKLEIAGKSLFFKSLISIIVFIILDIITKNLIISIIGIIIVNIIMLIMFDFYYCKKNIDDIRIINKVHIIKIFKYGFFTFAITFLGMYILNSPKYAIDNFLENDFQTIFGIIVMPATVVSLVAQFLIHPYLNQLYDFYTKKELKEFNKLIFKLIVIVIMFGLLASIAAFLIGTQALGLVYGIDLTEYKTALAIIIVSATLYTIGTIYSSALTTVRATFSQFIIYILVSCYAFIASNFFIAKFYLNGAIFAYFSIMLIQSLLYVIYSNFKLKKVFK